MARNIVPPVDGQSALQPGAVAAGSPKSATNLREPPAGDVLIDLEDDLARADAFGNLLLWITRARSLIETVQSVAEHHEEFRRDLQDEGGALHSATWGLLETNGLEYLQLTQHERILSALDSVAMGRAAQ